MSTVNWLHFLMGVEGVALLRTWLTQPRDAIEARVANLQQLVGRLYGSESFEADIPLLDYEEGYAAWATTYDAMPNPLIAVEEPVVRELLDRCGPGLALDAACGTGRHAAYLASRGHQVIGVDLSAHMLDRARQRVPGGDFRVGSFDQLPLADDSVDLAVCSLSLTHVERLDGPIRELARVVRPGGRVVLC